MHLHMLQQYVHTHIHNLVPVEWSQANWWMIDLIVGYTLHIHSFKVNELLYDVHAP